MKKGWVTQRMSCWLLGQNKTKQTSYIRGMDWGSKQQNHERLTVVCAYSNCGSPLTHLKKSIPRNVYTPNTTYTEPTNPSKNVNYICQHPSIYLLYSTMHIFSTPDTPKTKNTIIQPMHLYTHRFQCCLNRRRLRIHTVPESSLAFLRSTGSATSAVGSSMSVRLELHPE